MIKKEKCIEIKLVGSNEFLVLKLKKGELDYLIDLFEVGDKFELELIEMSEKKFEKLPEFDGF